MIDPVALREQADHHQVQPEALEKVLRLTDVLHNINKHPFLSGRLALKGGTALNLFFGPPKRLSVDIDLNYVGSVDREEMLKEKHQIERELELIGTSLRYWVQAGGDEHAGRTWFFGFSNHTNRQDRIEVDVSYLYRVPLAGLQRRKPWSPLGESDSSVLICSPEELVAGKLRALLDRVAARDVFDATQMMSLMSDFDRPLFKRLFVLLAGTLDHPLSAYSPDRLDRLTRRDVDNHLVPLLFAAHEVDRDKLVRDAKQVVSPLVELDEAEREFSRLLNAGSYRPEILLAEWPEVLRPLERHPALLWKERNAKKRR